MRFFVRMSEMDETERRGRGAAIGDFPAAAALAERRVPRARPAPGARPEPAGENKDKDARVANLTSALRRARLANAERSDVLADLREAEVARLEILQDHLAPVLAQVPKDCDLFDIGLTHGERPRLFIDHVGFVEMGRDRRVYRFLQDTRHGRVTIGESENLATVVDAITEYIAHRLVERERALAFDFAGAGGARAFAAEAPRAQRPAPSRAPSLRDSAYRIVLFLAQGAGAAAFFWLAWLLAAHALAQWTR